MLNILEKSSKICEPYVYSDLYPYFGLLTDYRACHAGIGRGDGWVVPLNIYIETQQFIPSQCSIFENLGKFVTAL